MKIKIFNSLEKNKFNKFIKKINNNEIDNNYNIIINNWDIEDFEDFEYNINIKGNITFNNCKFTNIKGNFDLQEIYLNNTEIKNIDLYTTINKLNYNYTNNNNVYFLRSFLNIKGNFINLKYINCYINYYVKDNKKQQNKIINLDINDNNIINICKSNNIDFINKNNKTNIKINKIILDNYINNILNYNFIDILYLYDDNNIEISKDIIIEVNKKIDKLIIHYENIFTEKNIKINDNINNIDFYDCNYIIGNFKNINIHCFNCKNIIGNFDNIWIENHFDNNEEINNINIIGNINKLNLSKYDKTFTINYNFSYFKKLELNDYNIIPYNLINLEELEINNCNNIKELPDNLINLKNLKINHCYKINHQINHQINHHNNIKKIPNTYINLQQLELNYCDNIKELPNNLINLEKLEINNCDNIKELPNNLINLKILKLNNCNNIKELPNNLNNLEELEINYCNNIKKIPKLINLEKLIIYDCENIEKISKKLINLKELEINYCNNIKKLPIIYKDLQKLTEYNYIKKYKGIDEYLKEDLIKKLIQNYDDDINKMYLIKLLQDNL